MVRSRWLEALAVAFLIAVVLAFSHWSPVPLSYDFGGHLSRVYILLNDGLGWTTMWYNGYDLFHFYPPLYYLVSLPIAFLSFELVRPFSFALFGFTAFLSMYYYAQQKLSHGRAIAAGLFFLTGWTLYIVHVSGSMPQALAAALAPAFYAKLEQALEGRSPFPAGILAAAIILLHHNAAIVVGLGAVIYMASNYRENVLNAAFSGAVAVLVSAFWLLPAIWEFQDASYSAFWGLEIRGVETVLGSTPLLAFPLVVKLVVSLDSVKKHRTEALVMLTGVVLSVGLSGVFLGYVPVFSRMPPYRIFLLAAFAASFLAAAARKKVVVPALIFCLVLSGYALGVQYDGGFQPGQGEAYNYISSQDVDLLYDSDNSDLRAYALVLHGKDIADGWSVGTTAIRPGLKRLHEYQLQQDERAVEFLRNWSADRVLTYQDSEENRNLHQLLNDSKTYELDRCFEEVCVFRTENERNAVLEERHNTYVVNASKVLPVPYSSHFNSSYRTENGFLAVKDGGVKTVVYQNRPVHLIGAVTSASSVIVFLALWLSGFRVPGRYSKLARHRLNHVRYRWRRKCSRASQAS